mgnify:CR=1 FL=1
MLSDLEISQSAKLRPIVDVAKDIGLSEDDIELYGKYKAKVSLEVLEKFKDKPNAKYIDAVSYTHLTLPTTERV